MAHPNTIKIYKLNCNQTPDTVYVGITETELMLRLFNHFRQTISSPDENRKKQDWLTQFWRNIEIHLLDEVDNISTARRLEAEYVLQFTQKGYKVLNNSYKAISVYCDNGDLHKVYGSIASMREELSIGNTCFHRHVNKNKPVKGFRFFDYNVCHEPKIDAYTHRELGRKVIQFSVSGEIIQEFINIKAASLAVKNIPKATGIVSCCQGKIKTAYGFKWKYKTN